MSDSFTLKWICLQSERRFRLKINLKNITLGMLAIFKNSSNNKENWSFVKYQDSNLALSNVA